MRRTTLRANTQVSRSTKTIPPTASDQSDVAKICSGALIGGGESDAAKIRRLEKELAEKTEEVEILGKAVAFFARRTDQ